MMCSTKKTKQKATSYKNRKRKLDLIFSSSFYILNIVSQKLTQENMVISCEQDREMKENMR